MAKGKHFPIMERMTVRAVREYLKTRQSVILPLGVTEQHGYHLPLCTDALIAAEISARVGRKIGMLVAPTINTSFSGGQLPGTINIHPSVMGLLIAEAARSLVAQGFKNLFLVLGHGGTENRQALNISLQMLLRDDPSFREVMVALFRAGQFAKRPAKMPKEFHAGWFETSLMLALAPQLVQMDQLKLDEPKVWDFMLQHQDNYQYASKPVDHEAVIPRMAQRPEIRVGVMGHPALASAAIGRGLVKTAVDGLAGLLPELEKKRSRTYRKVAWTPPPV